MEKTITILFIILSASIIANAQEKSDCPEVSLVGPPSLVRPGETMTFAVLLDKAAKQLNLDFKWEIDKGKIFNGQGTKTLRIKTDGLNEVTVTVDVRIKGLPDGCKNGLRETGIVAMGGSPLQLDDFGKITNDDVKARIDALIIYLQNEPTLKAFIVSYGTVNYVHSRQTLITNHGILRGFDTTRFEFANGGKGDARTKIWILPANTDTSFLFN